MDSDEQRLARENERLKAANNHNIVQYYGVSPSGVFESSPGPGLVSQLCKNGTVLEYLAFKVKSEQDSNACRLGLVSHEQVEKEQTWSYKMVADT